MTKPPALLRRLARDRSGATLIEFAFGFPFVLFLGLYGIELSNLAVMNLRVSQVALNLADNASRVGVETELPTLDLREFDINDVLFGAQQQGAGFDLTRYGRITLSSLERRDDVQRIHWQRCIGLKKGAGWDSSYGQAQPTDGADAKPENGGPRVDFMGPSHGRVRAPEGTAVMFVEINYEYQPLLAFDYIGTSGQRLHYTASFIVRDRRNLDQIFNPEPEAKPYTCDRYSAT